MQLIRNTADATIKGIDAEITVAATDDFILRGSLGYVDGEYNDVRYDISGDGVVDDNDKQLEIPRLAPWSYGGEAIYSTEFSWATFTAQAGYYRRDAAYYTDNNLGQLREADMVNARLAFGFMENRLRLSVFGKNLKDQPTIGGDTQLPFFALLGAPGVPDTFSPLNKGRIYGVELQYVMD